MTDVLPPLNQSAAATLSTEIEELLDQIYAHELKLRRSYARLGSLLLKVKTEQFWIIWGFERFSSYLESVQIKIGIQRSQAYAYLQIAESLLPYISEAKLEEIGSTKAHELRRLVKQGGNVESLIYMIPDDPMWGGFEESVRIMDYAANPKTTAAQLRVKVNELLHQTEEPQGLWYDLGGFYATSEERKEIEEFWMLGRVSVGVVDEQSEHTWKKQVFLDAVRELSSTLKGEMGDARR